MPSSFMGIEIGKRSLIAHTQGLHTVGHNISNADAEGYSRQRVEMKAAAPLYDPALNREERPGQIGQGINVQRIERVKDMLLEGRIVSETNGLGYWTARDKYILMLEQIYNEPAEVSVRSQLDKFWEGWQELSLHPAEMAARQAVVQRGETLIDAIHNRFDRLKAQREMLNDDVIGTVKEVNDIIRGVAALNEEIIKVKAMGDNPNDLLDRRDLLVNKLSSLIDITISERDPDEYSVYTGGMHIVQGKEFRLFATTPDPENESHARITWEGTENEAYFRGGKLYALLELRDGDVREEIQKLDLMAINFMDMVNEIHRTGYGLTKETGLDFFIEHPFVNNSEGNYDRNGDGAFDSTYIFRVTGNQRLDLKTHIGIEGRLTLPGPLEPIEVSYFATDTVEDVIERINNSGAEVVARLNREGLLNIKGLPAADTANPDFVIRHLEDSGQFLVGYAGVLVQSGAAGAFDWQAADQVAQFRGEGLDYAVAPLNHPAGWIEVNPAISREPAKVASAFDAVLGGPGDGSAALAIAQLRTEPVMIGQRLSFDDFFASAVAEIGLKGEQASVALDTENLILKELNDMKASLSGVNIDEELANMIKYQHGYSATARFVSEVDKMLDLIINRMAV